jgi:hypothetical protein
MNRKRSLVFSKNYFENILKIKSFSELYGIHAKLDFLSQNKILSLKSLQQ